MTDFRPLHFIELEGYKSFKALPKFQLGDGLNVMIGANGSGKTNFVRFFELLGHIMEGQLQNYLSENGRADAFVFRGTKVTQQFRAHLWFGRNEYRFTLKAAADRSMFFAEEAAPFDGPRFGKVTYDQGAGHAESELSLRFDLSPGEEWVMETISDWRVYHFHDTSKNSRMMGLCNLADSQKLQRDAGNIAPFLLRLSEVHPDHYDRIVKTIRLVAPFFGDFALREIAAFQTQLLWTERYGDQVYYPHQLSDGTIRFICLATLLLQPSPPSTIVIDEPELGLHPYAIEVLAALLREASRRGQLLISTQSRHLVDEFEPEQLIVVDRKDGETTLNRFDTGQLEGWLKDYSLSELWLKNVLGGRPQP